MRVLITLHPFTEWVHFIVAVMVRIINIWIGPLVPIHSVFAFHGHSPGLQQLARIRNIPNIPQPTHIEFLPIVRYIKLPHSDSQAPRAFSRKSDYNLRFSMNRKLFLSLQYLLVINCCIRQSDSNQKYNNILY